MLAVEAMEARIRAVDLRHPGAQPSGAHQPLDAATAHRPAVCSQGPMDPGTAVGPVMLLEERLHPVLQLPVLGRVGTGGAVAPGVIARAGDAIQRAEPRHRVPVPLRVDERERVRLRAAQNRMAFFRRACSS